MDPTPALRLLGRAQEGFRRAVAAHTAAWSAGRVETSWLELPELQQRVLGGGDLDADLVVVPADWLPAMAASGTLRPLEPDVDLSPWSASFAEGVSYDGRVWALPFHDGPQLLFTRPDLGVAPPGSWDELLAEAARHHRPGLAGTLLAGAPDGHNNVYDLAVQVWRCGGDLLQPDSPGFRRALDFLRRLVTTAVAADAHGLDSVRSGQAFAAGGAACMVNWAGYAADATAAGLTFATELAPGTTVNAFWATAITAGCRDPRAARAYLAHATSAEMDLATTGAGASGARLSTWADPGVLRDHPEHALFEAAHAASRPLPRTPALPAVVDVLSELVDAVVWRGEPAGPAVARARDGIAALHPNRTPALDRPLEQP